MTNSSRKKFYKVTLPALFVLWTFLIYGPSLKAPFQFDDALTIQENPFIKQFNLPWLFGFDPSRFLTYLSFAVNYYFAKTDVLSYHLVNTLLHMGVAALVFVFLREIFLTKFCCDGGDKKRLAWVIAFAGLIFLCHPLQTEGVTFVSQRSMLLAGLCYLSTLIFYIRFRRENIRKHYMWALVFMGIGLFTKPIVVTLPLAIILCDVMFFDVKPNELKKMYKLWLPFFFLSLWVVMFLVQWKYKTFDPAKFLSMTRESAKFSRHDYLLTQFNVLMTYLRLLFIPVYQNLDYDYKISKSFFGFPTYLSFSVLTLLIILAVRLYSKERIISFCIFWFFVTLSLESSIFPISDVIFEHRLYLAMIGFGLLISYTVNKICKRIEIYFLVMCLIVGILSFLTLKRNMLWSDKIAFLSDITHKSPLKPRTHNNLAIAYHDKGDLTFAKEEYLEAIRLGLHYAHPHNNLANIYYMDGKLDEAIVELKKAIDVDPGYETAYFNLGNAYHQQGKLKEAETMFKKALSVRLAFPQPHVALGNLYLEAGNLALARFHFLEALRFNQDYALAYHGLGDVYLNEKDYDAALEEYKIAISKNPNLTAAYVNIGNIYDIKQDYNQAVWYYQKIIQIDPNFANAYFNLANTLNKLHRTEESKRNLKMALTIYEKRDSKRMIKACQDRWRRWFGNKSP